MRPVIAADVAEPVVVTMKLPGDDVTVYPAMELLPVSAEAAHVTVADASPAVAATLVGALGGAAVVDVPMVTALDGAEELTPQRLRAYTMKV